MNKPIIAVREGKLQGTTLKSVLGPDYLAWKGIPFAQPPIGPLRFREPQPPLKWTGIRDASKHAGDVSMQYQSDGPPPYKIFGSEDCLYLNVYAKNLGSKKPVMFFIHGGGFIEDTGNDSVYAHDYLVTRDMVLVTTNYRLGPMGFLNLGHEVAPGNQAVRDVISALKWVQMNIEAFGGDSNNVTIFGSSAGSAISHLLTLIPAAKGLFHKAVLQSGTNFFVTPIITGKNVINGFRIASLLGLDSKDPEEVIEFLRKVPAEELIKLQSHVFTNEEKAFEGLFEYSPVYDGDSTKDPIVPAPLKDLLKNDSHIPIMIGQSSDESLLFYMGKFDDDDTYKFHNDNFKKILKNMLILKDPSKFPELMADINEFYFKNKPVNRDTVWNLIRFMSDMTQLNHNRKIIDDRNDHACAPTYAYNFSYMGDEPTIYQFDKGPQPLKGVAHADELSYMFYLSYIREIDEHKDKYPREGTKDWIVMERLLRMWFNFAAIGNPTPETDDQFITTIWPPSSKETLFYLDIGENLELRSDKDSESRSLYEKIRRHFAY